MVYKLFKNLLITLVITTSLSSVVFADSMNMDNGTEKKVDGISIELSFKNDKVKTGDSDIMITLHDDKEQPVKDAKVTATAEMDKNMDMDMKDSKPVAIEFNNSDEQGQYMGTINFTDKGKWIIKTTINLNGQEKKVDFDVDVAGSGPNWGIIGGFLGIVAVILVVAAVKKKQSVKA